MVPAPPGHGPALQGLVREEGGPGVGDDPQQGRAEASVEGEEALLLVDADEDEHQVLVLLPVAVGDGHHGPGPVEGVGDQLARGASQAARKEPGTF